MVVKQGVFNLVFHPHGWIKAEQIVELIDHAQSKHGGKVKFLTFREANERLENNLLDGTPLRNPEGLTIREVDADGDGSVNQFEYARFRKRLEDAGRPVPGFRGRSNGVRLLDVNDDGWMDVVIGNPDRRETRVWDPESAGWKVTGFPANLTGTGAHARFGVLQREGMASLLVSDAEAEGVWHFDGGRWVEDLEGLRGLEIDGKPVRTTDVSSSESIRRSKVDRGVRLRDLDGDGRCEVLVANLDQRRGLLPARAGRGVGAIAVRIVARGPVRGPGLSPGRGRWRDGVRCRPRAPDDRPGRGWI